MTARIDLTAEQFRELARSIWLEAFETGFNQGERGTLPDELTDGESANCQELWDQSASKVTVENLLAVEATPGGEG